MDFFYVVHGVLPEGLELNATVTERGTVVTYNTSDYLFVAREPYTLSFLPGTRSFFKAGLPFYVTVSGQCNYIQNHIYCSVLSKLL